MTVIVIKCLPALKQTSCMAKENTSSATLQFGGHQFFSSPHDINAFFIYMHYVVGQVHRNKLSAIIASF
jgi:hypothetical protein